MEKFVANGDGGVRTAEAGGVRRSEGFGLKVPSTP